MSQKHLSEDRLIELCLTGAIVPGDEAHLISCGDCELRRLTLALMLNEIDTAADVEVDAAFPADRLARQRARILQRIDHEGRPGRLIAFPASPVPAMVLRSRPRARLAAAAVAAAFIVGLLAGRFASDLPVTRVAGPAMIANERDATPLRAVSTTWSDDEFLAQIEQAAFRVSPAALAPIDAMTPRAWEVR